MCLTIYKLLDQFLKIFSIHLAFGRKKNISFLPLTSDTSNKETFRRKFNAIWSSYYFRHFLLLEKRAYCLTFLHIPSHHPFPLRTAFPPSECPERSYDNCVKVSSSWNSIYSMRFFFWTQRFVGKGKLMDLFGKRITSFASAIFVCVFKWERKKERTKKIIPILTMKK